MFFYLGISAHTYENQIQNLKSQLEQSDLNTLIKTNEVLQLKDRLANEQQKLLSINSNLMVNTTGHSMDVLLSNQIHEPSIQTFLPHLKKKPRALVPAVKTGKNKLGGKEKRNWIMRYTSITTSSIYRNVMWMHKNSASL